MDPPDRGRASEIFLRAVELPPGERDAFVDEECAGDTELRAQVLSLLRHDAGWRGTESRFRPAVQGPLPADDRARELTISPDGRLVAAVCLSLDEQRDLRNRIVVWDLATAEVVFTDEDRTKRPQVLFSPDNRRLLVFGSLVFGASPMKLYDTTDFTELLSAETTMVPLAFTPDGRDLILRSLASRNPVTVGIWESSVGVVAPCET